jgi:ankyrin repeat protein
VASSRGHLSCVHYLLDSNAAGDGGGDIDEQDKWGNTALHLAARRKYLQVSLALMQAGADVDLVNCVSMQFTFYNH